MKKNIASIIAAFVLTLGGGFSASVLCTDMDWQLKEELKLGAEPLDMEISPDGQWFFVLVPGKVLVYSGQDRKMVKEIPVEDGFDAMTYSAVEKALLLVNGSKKKISFIELEPIHTFDLSGLPAEGAEDAAVTVVVFSDYQ